MDRILAILTDETEYARELASYLSSRPDFIFKPMIFADPEEYLRFDETNHVDMLLCSEEEALNRGGVYKADNICILAEYNMVAEGLDYPGIFKYQSSEGIMRSIIDFYGKRKREPGVNSRDITNHRRMICVTSPIGGCGTSTFALGLSQYLSRGGRTLFISFDPFFMFPQEPKSHKDKNLTDIIYYIETAGAWKEESFCDPENVLNPVYYVDKIAHHRGNLDYVTGVSCWFDITELSASHLRILMSSLLRSNIYENVVFDMGVIGSASMEILAGCGEIYVPVRIGARYEKVLTEWKRQLSFAGRNKLMDKVKELEIPYDESLKEDYTFESLLKGRVGDFIEEREGLSYLK